MNPARAQYVSDLPSIHQLPATGFDALDVLGWAGVLILVGAALWAVAGRPAWWEPEDDDGGS